MPITDLDDRIRVFSSLADLGFRICLTLVGSGLWVYLTVALIRHPGLSYAGADSFLSLTMGAMFKYYFWRADPEKKA